jgi:hypothetical protein
MQRRGSSASCTDWPAMLQAPQDCISYLGSSISDWPHAGASTMAALVTSVCSCPRKLQPRTELRAARHRHTVNSPPCPNMLACKIRRPSRASVPTPHLFQDQPLRTTVVAAFPPHCHVPRATCHTASRCNHGRTVTALPLLPSASETLSKMKDTLRSETPDRSSDRFEDIECRSADTC